MERIQISGALPADKEDDAKIDDAEKAEVRSAEQSIYHSKRFINFTQSINDLQLD